MGTGRPTDGQTDRAGAGRVRAAGVGGAGARALRLDGGTAPRGGRRGARARAGGALRPGDGQEPEHRAAGLAEDVRLAARLAERRARVESSGRPAASAGSTAGAVPGLRGQGGAADGAGGGAGPAPADHGVPAAGRGGGCDRGPGGGDRGPQGAGLGDPAAGAGLRDGAGSGERAEVEAERSDL